MKEEAVSDAIGVILLIAIATLAIGIIGVNLFSQISVTEIPQADLTIIWQDNPLTADDIDIVPFVYFERGEPLFFESIRIQEILKDGEQSIPPEIKIKIKKRNTNSYDAWGPSMSFSIGDTLGVFDYDSDNPPKIISIIYQKSGKEILLKSGENPFL